MPGKATRLIGPSLFLLLLFIPFALPSVSQASSQLQFQDAVSLMEQREYSQALDLLHKLESSLPDPARVSGLLAAAYLGLGYQSLLSADLPAARAAFQEGRRYNEKDVRLWEGEAMVWFKLGRYADAAALLDQALGVIQQDSGLYALLGRAYYADGLMVEALEALTQAVNLGAGEDVAALLASVDREWQVEREMEQEVRGHFQLSFVDNERAATLAPMILEALENAYSELGADFSFYPEVKVPVLLYSGQDFTAVTSSPDWAGAVYDGKIRLPLGGIHQINEQLVALLYHEYMHVLVHFMAQGKAPVWLNEGLAEMAGRRVSPQPLLSLREAASANQLLGWSELAAPFTSFDGKKAALAYEQSYSLTSFLVDRFGWHTMAELLSRIGNGVDCSSAMSVVYRDYGLDWPAILVEWRGSLRG